jgi:drug/metabolite transporter (DMT)-like permease
VPSTSRRTAPALRCFTAALLFGASPPATKALLGDGHALTLAGLLYVGAALAVLPFASRTGSAPRRRDRKQIARLGGAVVFGGLLGPVFLLLGLAGAPAASVSLWLNLESVATAALAWAFFREHVTPRTWAAVALIAAAGVLLATPGDPGLAPSAALVALASLCWGLDNNLTSVIDAYTPAQVTLVKGAVAGVTNLVLGLVLEGAAPSAPFVAFGLCVGALAYGASLVLHIGGSQELGATRAQAIFSVAPFVGVAISWAFFREPVLGVQLLAAGVMVAGLACLFTGRHEHEHVHEALAHTHEHSHDEGHHGHEHPGAPVAGSPHSHEHFHEGAVHAHAHDPDLHHRHEHG